MCKEVKVYAECDKSMNMTQLMHYPNILNIHKLHIRPDIYYTCWEKKQYEEYEYSEEICLTIKNTPIHILNTYLSRLSVINSVCVRIPANEDIVEYCASLKKHLKHCAARSYTFIFPSWGEQSHCLSCIEELIKDGIDKDEEPYIEISFYGLPERYSVLKMDIDMSGINGLLIKLYENPNDELHDFFLYTDKECDPIGFHETSACLLINDIELNRYIHRSTENMLTFQHHDIDDFWENDPEIPYGQWHGSSEWVNNGVRVRLIDDDEDDDDDDDDNDTWV